MKKEKEETEQIKNVKYEIEKEIKTLQKEIADEEEALRVLQEIDKITNMEKLEQEKLNVHINAKNELENEKQKQREEIENITQIKIKKKTKNILYLIPGIFLIISVVLFILSYALYGTVGIIASLISSCIISAINFKENKERINEKNKKIENIKNKIEIINNQIKSKEKDIKDVKTKLQYNTKLQKENLYMKSINAKRIIDGNIYDVGGIIKQQNHINGLKLNLKQKEMKKEQINEKIERLNEITERLNSKTEELKDILEYNEAINIAKETMRNAYTEMKENITPKFTENLSKTIEKITKGKYKKVIVNEEKGLAVEAENGNYITGAYLSQGTTDQLYFALRISSLDELISENMMVILDETFAYFDTNRLENVLRFLNENYSEKQIIILTCTKREIEIMDSIGIKYNEIEL